MSDRLWSIRSALTRLLMLASFLVSMGMHTAVIQAVAWAKMTVDFVRHETIAASLEKTFDGRHPCPICCSLRKVDGSASLAAAPVHSRLGFVSPSEAPRVARVILVWGVAAPTPPAFAHVLAPVSPPPKALLS